MATIQEVLGALGLDDIVGEDDVETLIAAGDQIGIDEILGAVAKQPGGLKKLAALKAAGQRGLERNNQPSSMKVELLPIPLGTIPAGGQLTVTVVPTRSQRVDRVTFPSSNVDHQFVNLVSMTILGVEQLNGTGGVRCSSLSEMRSEPGIRGSTAQRSDNIVMVFANTDTVNARTVYGEITGPTVREVG